MKKKIEVHQRKGIIGASDVGAILGISPYSTPYEAYLAYTGQEIEHSPETIEIMRMGTELEEFISQQVMRIYDCKLRRCNSAFFNPETPYIICHPDRIEVGLDDNGQRVGVEIKSSSVYDKSWGEEDTDQVPYSYLCQCLMYMYCGVCDVVKLYRFSNNKITRYIIQRNVQLINKIVEKLKKFKADADGGIAPSAVSISDIKTRWAIADKDKALANEDIKQKLVAFKAIKAEQDISKKNLEKLQVDICNYIADANFLVDDDFETVLATFKNQTRSRFDSKRFKLEQPELSELFTETKDIRVLLIK